MNGHDAIELAQVQGIGGPLFADLDALQKGVNVADLLVPGGRFRVKRFQHHTVSSSGFRKNVLDHPHGSKALPVFGDSLFGFSHVQANPRRTRHLDRPRPRQPVKRTRQAPLTFSADRPAASDK
jgi:hypothetical protein